jgi:hypothetical protein
VLVVAIEVVDERIVNLRVGTVFVVVGFRVGRRVAAVVFVGVLLAAIVVGLGVLSGELRVRRDELGRLNWVLGGELRADPPSLAAKAQHSQQLQFTDQFLLTRDHLWVITTFMQQ